MSLGLTCLLTQGWAYLNGTVYTKHVDSANDPAVTMEDSNCTFIKRLPDGTLEFECFEKDLVWGLVTIGIMFLPGLQLYSLLIAWTTEDVDGDGKIDKDETAGKNILLFSPLFVLVRPNCTFKYLQIKAEKH